MVPGLVEPGIQKRAVQRKVRTWINALLILALIYLFLVAMKVMGSSFKALGGGFAGTLVRLTSNPLSGLFIGILATAIIQSSSVVTSLTVGLVAANALDATVGLTLVQAVPIVMGANIGTSITNTLVSLVHIRRRDEFRRAFAGAIVHDLFNWCTVLVFFPLEYCTGYLGRLSRWITQEFFHAAEVEGFKPVDAVVNPLKEVIVVFFERVLGLKGAWLGGVLAVLSVVMLFVVLLGLTTVLKKSLVGGLERVIDRFLFRNAPVSFLVGLITTSIIQSSSVTTSLVVPLLGAGLLTIEQVYPYTLGANIGTTVTAFIAALATPAGFTVALVHLLFNVHGVIIFYPLRRIPIGAARWYAEIAARRPRYAALFIIVVFFAVPLAVIGLSRLLGG